MEQAEFYAQKLSFEIDSWDLHELTEKGEAVVVIDTRGREAFAREHIPEAVSLPHREMSPETTADFDKDVPVVTYCDGIGCNASTKGALNMVRLGFSVRELLGGLDWWKRDGYPTRGTGDPSGRQGQSCGC